MHKLLHRVQSNSKDAASDKKKKKGAKANLKSALKSTIAPPLALSHSEASPNSIPSTAPSDQNDDTNEDFYSLASDDVFASKEAEIEEDVYENTDTVLADMPSPSEKRNLAPPCVAVASFNDRGNQSNTEEGLYDMADSFGRSATPVKAELAKNESDEALDDTYSHLTTESATTDQLYDRLERNLSDASDTNDTVYNCLGEHELSNPLPNTQPTSQASCYEDVDITFTNVPRKRATTLGTHSELSQDHDDTYEDVSFALPVKPRVPSIYQGNESTEKQSDDDTYEAVSNLPIPRFREPQQLPPRPNAIVDTKPQSANTESVPTNVSLAKHAPPTIDVTPQKREAELTPADATNDARHSLKHSKAKHPSQWFSKPFLKAKPKFDLRKRANSKQNTLNLDENAVPVSPTETKPASVNIRSRARLPTPQEQGRLTSPTRLPLADSLEDSPLYKTMQEKLRIPNND